jgi:SAM-dependent methyltransferase
MSDPMNKDVHEANRRSWNAATAAHNSHKRDQADFLRGGGSTLFAEELSLLGDVAGRRLVHLQCNAGQDTLSLARLGAMVTGVDISDEAIAFARKLSADTGIPATFHRADVYDWFEAARQRGEQFDVVFCSYGCVCWLSDLDRWAAGIFAVLVPGGRFVAVDFHPVALMFDEHLNLAFPYFGKGKPLQWEEGVSDYVAASGPAMAPSGYQEGVHDFKNPHAAYEFQWHLGAILTALLQSGLRIEQFSEYSFFNAARLYDDMREEDRRMYPPDRVPSFPLMYGVVAAKPDSKKA